MEKRHNYAAAGFLLLGIGAAGRAFLGVPEGVTMAELSLTVLLVIGALLLTRQGLAALVCGLAATALELVLCGSWVQAGGALAAAAPFLRLADLWLLLGIGGVATLLTALNGSTWLLMKAASASRQTIRNQKRAPLPGSLSICSALPWAAAMRRQSASPSPLPP